MIPVQALFESHLTVGDLERSMAFYGGALAQVRHADRLLANLRPISGASDLVAILVQRKADVVQTRPLEAISVP